MAKFLVKGGRQLKGTVTVGGSKNAALPIICAALLSKGKSTLKNIPDIADIHSMVTIIRSLGAKVRLSKNTNAKRSEAFLSNKQFSRSENTMEIDPANLSEKKIDNKLIAKMRASILLLGPLLHRFGEIKMAFPGGCVLGKRSVFAHTFALKELGATILDETRELHLKIKKLQGKKIILPELSVTATENAVMVAVLAPGETQIRLAAAEPHVQDFCKFLNKMGAKISGIGTNSLKIKGVKSLKGAVHTITGDYLEAGTFAVAAVATGGDVEIKGINVDHLDSLWQKLGEVGAKFELKKNSVHLFPTKKLEAVKNLKTAVYPGFPTDLQAPFTVLLTGASGVSKIFETLFEGRLNYLFELERMGAHVEFLNPHQALIIGPHKLKGMPISSWDIRAGAAMVIAALMADGETEISNINYIDRGYEKLELKLRSLGADIKRQ